MHGGKFYYGDKRVSDANALQIPLESIEDDMVTKNFYSFKAIRSVSRVVSIIPMVYTFTIINSNQTPKQKVNTYTAIFAGTIAINLLSNLISNLHFRKGIDRYNSLILDRSKLGLNFESLPNKQPSIGFRIDTYIGKSN